MRLHKFTLAVPAWPIAVYEGDKQLVCEEDYVQVAEVFYVATQRPEEISLKRLILNDRSFGRPTVEFLKALPPDKRERYSSGALA